MSPQRNHLLARLDPEACRFAPHLKPIKLPLRSRSRIRGVKSNTPISWTPA
jgi:hypothetical protein